MQFLNKPICLNCANRMKSNPNGVYYCAAFPNTEKRSKEDIEKRKGEGITLDPKGIPDEIIWGENDHSVPLEGQEGEFVYNPILKDGWDKVVGF